MTIIGITGTSGAGKGTVVEYLISKYGFVHYSARAFISEETKKRGLSTTRDNLISVANDLRKIHGPGYIIDSLIKEATKLGQNAVVESVRALGEIEILRACKEKTFLLAVDADVEKRYERIFERKSETDHVSFEKFVAEEKKESDNQEPWKGNLPACIKKADYVLENNGTKEDLEKKIDEIIGKINS